MSHHASGPNFGFPRGDARLDMTDLYAFTKPGDPAKSIIILDVHPSFRLDSPEPTTSEPFAHGTRSEKPMMMSNRNIRSAFCAIFTF